MSTAGTCLQKVSHRSPLTEPILQNIGVVKPEPSYLSGLRTLADEFGFPIAFRLISCSSLSQLSAATQARHNSLPRAGPLCIRFSTSGDPMRNVCALVLSVYLFSMIGFAGS